MKTITPTRDITSDVLRIIATVFVFLAHGLQYLSESAHEQGIWITSFPAWAGVWILFVLSGYGIGLSFFSKRYSFVTDTGVNVKGFLSFYLKRFIRIAPTYYLYCLMFELLSHQYSLWNNPDAFIQILTFTYNGSIGIQGIGHLWYISTAMQLYLIMPFILLAVEYLLKTKLQMTVTVIILFIVGITVRCTMYQSGADWYTQIYTNFLTNIDLVSIGIVAAKYKKYYAPPSNNLGAYILLILVFAILTIYNCYINFIGSRGFMFTYKCILPSLYAIVCFLILESHITKDLTTMIGTKITSIVTFLSKQSYSFYILHIAFLSYFGSTLLTTAWFKSQPFIIQYLSFFVITMVLTLICSVILTWVGDKIANYFNPIIKRWLS